MKSIIAVILLITLSLLNTTGTADDTEEVSYRELQVEEAMIPGTDEDAIEEAEEAAPAEETDEPATVFEEVTEETEILPEEKSEKPVVHAAKKVVITEDNFFDYFEIVERRELRENTKRHTTTVYVTVSLRLRDGLMYAMPYGFDNGVTVKYSYVREKYEYIDPAGIRPLDPGASIPRSGKAFSAEECDTQIVFPEETVLFTSKYTYSSADNKVSISCAKDLVFESVSGYFYLVFDPGE